MQSFFRFSFYAVCRTTIHLGQMKKRYEEYLSLIHILSTRPTPKIPSKPVTKTSIEKMLKNPYYAGVIRYNGIEYDGAHEALIDLETFNKVQNIIQSHHNGERTREHPHFLKGLVYCWNCKSRMVVTHAKSHTGNVYPYFICAGRHRTKSARQTCRMRSIEKRTIILKNSCAKLYSRESGYMRTGQ